jgi:hypothetical protein
MAGTRSAAGVADDSTIGLLAQLSEGNREIEPRLIPQICNESRWLSFDPPLGCIVELHFFGGLTFDEIAIVLHISERTAKCELTMAKTWLKRELSGQL